MLEMESLLARWTIADLASGLAVAVRKRVPEEVGDGGGCNPDAVVERGLGCGRPDNGSITVPMMRGVRSAVRQRAWVGIADDEGVGVLGRGGGGMS